jgi:transposase
VFDNDEEFAELYPDRGQSALAPWRLTIILIMQFLENLSDRQIADAVRGRIDWKYALSLELLAKVLNVLPVGLVTKFI